MTRTLSLLLAGAIIGFVVHLLDVNTPENRWKLVASSVAFGHECRQRGESLEICLVAARRAVGR